MNVQGHLVWITGLPSSGKSTFAERAAARLRECGRACCVLDGDAVRAALVPSPGYSQDERDAFYATLGRLAVLIAVQGLVVLVPATAHKRAYRDAARHLAPAFTEVFVSTDAAECAQRDEKGLYAAARSGGAWDLPGMDLEYERSASAEVVTRGGFDEAALEELLVRVDSA